MSDAPPKKEKQYPLAAYANQGSSVNSKAGAPYLGADLWGYTELPKGTILVQLEHDPERLTSNRTASQYFTTGEELEKHRDPKTGKVDTVSLSESVQVMAGRYNPEKKFEHHSMVTVYEVVEDMPVAYAKVTDNPAFGHGGADQYFTPVDPADIVRQERTVADEKGAQTTQMVGYLKPLEIVEASNNIPSRPLYDDIKQAEAAQTKNALRTVVQQFHNDFKTALHQSGDPTSLLLVQGKEEREKFAKDAVELIEKSDWKGMNEAVLPKPRTPIETLEYSLGAVRNPTRRVEITKLMNELKDRNVAKSMNELKTNGVAGNNQAGQNTQQTEQQNRVRNTQQNVRNNVRETQQRVAQNERVGPAQSQSNRDFDIGD